MNLKVVVIESLTFELHALRVAFLFGVVLLVIFKPEFHLWRSTFHFSILYTLHDLIGLVQQIQLCISSKYLSTNYLVTYLLTYLAPFDMEKKKQYAELSTYLKKSSTRVRNWLQCFIQKSTENLSFGAI